MIHSVLTSRGIKVLSCTYLICFVALVHTPNSLGYIHFECFETDGSGWHSTSTYRDTLMFVNRNMHATQQVGTDTDETFQACFPVLLMLSKVLA